MLGSTATRRQAGERGFPTQAYPRAADPDAKVPFELQAERILEQAAGLELAEDVAKVAELRSADLLVVDCMLPAALAAGEATGVPTASLVHFPYALARSVMAADGGSWTTDRETLDSTRRALDLPPTAGDIDAWESPDLVLATLPRWFDVPGELPAHVVHAGPLCVRAQPGPRAVGDPPRAVLAFSTTAMEGQPELVASACVALDRAGVEGTLTVGPALQRPSAAGLEVVDWADHDALMRSCDVVVTHGGLGTTLRALAHGRPLLVLPLGRDQHFNASRVEEIGAGRQLPADSPPSAIADALLALLSDPSPHRGAARAALAIARDRPDERAGSALAGLAG